MEIHYPDAPGDSTPLQWKKLLKNQLHARLLSGTSPKPKSEDTLMLHLFVLWTILFLFVDDSVDVSFGKEDLKSSMSTSSWGLEREIGTDQTSLAAKRPTENAL